MGLLDIIKKKKPEEKEESFFSFQNESQEDTDTTSEEGYESELDKLFEKTQGSSYFETDSSSQEQDVSYWKQFNYLEYGVFAVEVFLIVYAILVFSGLIAI